MKASGWRLGPRWLLLALCALAPSLAAAAAGPHWVERHYGSLDGLPVDSVRSSAVDAHGFLWLATHDGLVRFDGEHFAVYESMAHPAMSGNRMATLHRDPQQRLYALTERGDWLRVRADSIRAVPLAGADGGSVRHVDQTSLCVTTAAALYCPDGAGAFPRALTFPPQANPALTLRGARGDYWMMTRQRHIFRYRDGAWKALRRASPDEGRLAPKFAAVAADGAFWAEIGGRLLRIDADGDVRAFRAPGDPVDITQLRRADDGSVWIGANNGVFTLTGGVPTPVFVAPDGAPGLYGSWSAPDAGLWVARHGTLWHLPAKTAADAADRRPVLESGGTIQHLQFGPGGLVWALTLHDGLYRLNEARVELLDRADGLPGGNVYGISRDGAGNMWLGTLDHGLVMVAADGAVRRFGAEAGLPGPNPWVVAHAPDGSTWVATYAPGLWLRPVGAERFRAARLPPALEQATIRAITFGADDSLWLGTSAGAWQRVAGQWRRAGPPGAPTQVNALAITARGAWYGSDHGVWFQHDGHGHAVAPQLLANTTVRGLDFTRDGALWVSTTGRGLVRVAADDPRGLRAVQLGRREGLPSNSPHALREDRQGNLWVNSNQGIFRIAPEQLAELLAGDARTLSPLVLGRSDGLTELEGNGGVQPAAAWDGEGRLWFPSQAGVVRFDPLAVRPRSTPPTPLITALSSEGREIGADARERLPTGVRDLQIAYGAANLFGSGKTRFLYRLLPVSDTWTSTAERSAAFTRLPPDTYEFQVRAANSDGIWSVEPTVRRFAVPRYWHESPLFRLTALLALLGALFALVQWRQRWLRERARTLDDTVRQRTRQLRQETDRVQAALAELAVAHTTLEERNLRLARQAHKLEELDRFRTRLLADVSHELRTPVMLVDLPLQELLLAPAGLPAESREHLELATHQLHRLQALVEQLVSLVQAESGQMPLRLVRLDLVAELERLARDYGPKAARYELHLRCACAAGAIILYADAAHLQTIFGNLVDNAIKHGPPGSEVCLTLEQDSEEVRVIVSDQGPGFDAAQAERLFERFYRLDGPPRLGREGLGIGLSLAHELVELHGGRIRAEGRPGAGARFVVTLPLGSAHVAVEDLALPAADALPASPQPQAGAGDAGCVLLVEDHPDLLAYLGERLRERLPTLSADSAEAALTLLAQRDDIHLVVSDIVLPGRSGLDLCRAATRGDAGARRPVILISARAGRDTREAGLAAGAVAFLAKPFSLDALFAAMSLAWPAVAHRLRPALAEAGAADPLLQVAIGHLPEAAFRIAAWAEQAHVSQRHLRRRVKELTGMSPQDWLREQRLLRVHQLLSSGRCKTLAQAGAMCGLDNPAYLYRSYRARFGEH